MAITLYITPNTKLYPCSGKSIRKVVSVVIFCEDRDTRASQQIHQILAQPSSVLVKNNSVVLEIHFLQ